MAEYVHRVTGLRHAHTNKAPQDSGYQGDLARTLSEPGRAQAAARRRSLGNPTYHRIGSSPLLRARETALLVGGVSNADRLTLIDEIGVEDPATGGDAQAIDVLFNQLGYAPLKAYHEADSAVMDRYANRAWGGIKNFLAPATRDERNLIVGHAVLICAAFLPAVQGYPAMADQLMNLNLNECGGFLIVLRGDEVQDFIVFNEKL